MPDSEGRTAARILVPTELWQRFRAEAILRGLSIGDALAMAIAHWLATGAK